MAHRVFILFLLLVGGTAAISIGISGWDYYSTPPRARAFRPDHDLLKPSGTFGHGLGIIGTTMIIVGIVLYSSRKRVRSLWNLGKLSTWLEVHMFLCLLGPTLVVYHTTFKAGGIAAISLWTMLSVVASGLVGRFLYVLIPRNIKGAELTSQQINEEFDRQRALLAQTDVGNGLIQFIDKNFAAMKRPSTIRETIAAFLHLQRIKRQVRHMVREMLKESHVTHDVARQVTRVAHARAALIQRSLLLLQVEKLFYYWHVIHLPFTAIMFVTLAAHVGVALWLGYTWIF